MKIVSLLFISTLIVSCNSNQKEESEHQGRPSVHELINEFDSNKDGKLSESEVGGPLASDFQKIDADKDGFLSEKELELAPKPPRKGGEQTVVNKEDIDATVKGVSVNTSYFIKENIIGEITEKKVNLSGIETNCYVIKTHSQATEHQMGPWCPRHIEDGMEKAGIWFENDKVYDVSGHFIANLDEFYSDDKWKLFREDGSVKVTDSEISCLAAAKPDVEEKYHNHCVECLPEYFKDQVTTFVIPVNPQYLKKTQSFGRGGIGVAFNGVKYDPPAPTHAILAAHTIAPLDDHGGHVNPHGGYHYHAITGSTKEVAQSDAHAPMIGYAIDGFGIYALLDENGNAPTDLDECGGHFDDERGYHYHAGEPGGNQIIACLHGLPGYTEVKE
ncbi:YHYH protein [Brumimicrobium mesophilum]|uniref:YHYH protein n=1 Tax=Brumimicrobium mesophilum TaxID=392717 RepID=UPI000D1430C7|nr:YHYH protein [Brumimicrobium mesophilum]